MIVSRDLVRALAILEVQTLTRIVLDFDAMDEETTRSTQEIKMSILKCQWCKTLFGPSPTKAKLQLALANSRGSGVLDLPLMGPCFCTSGI
jgi:hypothetical protein